MLSNPSDVLRAKELYQQGREALAKGDIAGAIPFFRGSGNLDPHFKTFELLGECLLLSGQPVAAVLPLAAVTGLNEEVRAPSLLAEALLLAGEHLRAGLTARRVLGLASSNRRAQRVLADPSVISALSHYDS